MKKAARRIEAGLAHGRAAAEKATPTMGLFDLTDLVLQRGLEGASLRQKILSNNLANANTAGFKRSDVDFESSLGAALASSDRSGAVAKTSFTAATDSTTAMTPDGNNVDLDQELSSLTENSVQYQALAAVERARLQTLQTAMGGTP
jgi:flagellar basal-body rod protein FlgB